MDNPVTLATLGPHDTGQRLVKTTGVIKNGQSSDTGHIGSTWHRTKTNKIVHWLTKQHTEWPGHTINNYAAHWIAKQHTKLPNNKTEWPKYHTRLLNSISNGQTNVEWPNSTQNDQTVHRIKRRFSISYNKLVYKFENTILYLCYIVLCISNE
jgi:hypothetical protein